MFRIASPAELMRSARTVSKVSACAHLASSSFGLGALISHFSSTSKSAAASAAVHADDAKLLKEYSVQFAADSFNTHKFPEPPKETTVTGKELLDMFRTMVEIRRLETASDQASL
jgi:hypothetical protein